MTDHEEIILPKDGAVFETREVTGWWPVRPPDNAPWAIVCYRDTADGERSARWAGSTHRTCNTCGTAIPKSSYCPACWDAKQREKWENLPAFKWDGQTPIMEFEGDLIFFDDYDLDMYLDDNEDYDLSLAMWVEAEPVYVKVDEESLIEEYTGGLDEESQWEMSARAWDLLERLNAELRACGPVYYKRAARRMLLETEEEGRQ